MSFRTLTDTGLTNARQQFQLCQQVGQLVLGYVFTGDGDRAVADVIREVDECVTNYGAAVDGFYFDSKMLLGPGRKTDQQYQDYYRPLVAGVRGRYPGRRIGLAASQYKYPRVIEVADFATIWEKPATDYLTNYMAGGEFGPESPPDWWKVNPDRVVVTIQATSDDATFANVLAAIQRPDRNAGNLYIHDDVSYGNLSRWWEAELSGLAGSGAAETSWGLTGNSGTSPNVDFLGTTDNPPLVIRANNAEALRVTATPTVMTVRGDLQLTNASGGDTIFLGVDQGANEAGAFLGGGNSGLHGRVVLGNSAGQNSIDLNGATGRVSCVSLTQTSDMRLKKEITPLSNALDKVVTLRGVRYRWKDEDHPASEPGVGSEIGLIGQEVESVYPELVATDAEGYKSLDYSHLTAVLVEAIKDQQQLIQRQASSLAEALQKIARIETALEAQSA